MVGIPDGAKVEISETVFHFSESMKRRKNKCPQFAGFRVSGKSFARFANGFFPCNCPEMRSPLP